MNMREWASFSRDVFVSIRELGKLIPDSLRGYMILSGNAGKAGHLDPRTREIVALAVSTALRSDGCRAVHLAEARKQGVTKEEIADALSVVIAVSAEAALITSAHTLEALAASDAAAPDRLQSPA